MPRVLIFALLVLVVPSAAAQFVPNYDEAQVPDYALPDPLRMQSGTPVYSHEAWHTERRPELLRLFARHVYGEMPPPPNVLRIEPLEEGTLALGGFALRKQVRLHFTPDPEGPKMDLLIYLPAERSGPVPVFAGLNFFGNQTIHNDPEILITDAWVADNDDLGITGNQAGEASRGRRSHRWPVEMILDRGYALVTAHYGDLDPDFDDGFQNGIHPLLDAGGRTETSAGALGAWGWGLSRMVDYAEQDPDLDAQRVAVVGHSRLGKAALWAGANDARFALVISNESGAGGAALSRRAYGETVGRITSRFPHWFGSRFESYSDREGDLPVDQHQLLALIAPRPLYVASAVEDRWADPHGEFLALLGADPVYRLYGYEALPTDVWPAVGVPVQGRTGYHVRPGRHDLTAYDWAQYLGFADRHLP